MSAHTPEPWQFKTVPTSVGTCHQIGPFPSNSGVRPETWACIYADNVRAHDYGHSKTGDELLANAARIVACVNAMEGIADPAAFVANANGCIAALRGYVGQLPVPAAQAWLDLVDAMVTQ